VGAKRSTSKPTRGRGASILSQLTRVRALRFDRRLPRLLLLRRRSVACADLARVLREAQGALDERPSDYHCPAWAKTYIGAVEGAGRRLWGAGEGRRSLHRLCEGAEQVGAGKSGCGALCLPDSRFRSSHRLAGTFLWPHQFGGRLYQFGIQFVEGLVADSKIVERASLVRVTKVIGAPNEPFEKFVSLALTRSGAFLFRSR